MVNPDTPTGGRSEWFAAQVARAEARMDKTSAARTAAASERAQLIAEEVTRRGHGGARLVARELGVSDQAISTAVARARTSQDPEQSLPPPLEQLYDYARATISPLSRQQWHLVARVLHNVEISAAWLDDSGTEHLAQAITHSGEGTRRDRDQLATACRSWSPVQAMAVLDACQHDIVDLLPITDVDAAGEDE